MIAVAAQAADFGSAAIEHRPYVHASSQHSSSKEGRGRGLVFGPSGPRSNVTKWPIRGKSRVLDLREFQRLTGELHGYSTIP
jgi:hypothetical protein